MSITLTEDQSWCVLSAYNHIMMHTLLRHSGATSGNSLSMNQNMVITGYAGSGKSLVIKTLWDKLMSAPPIKMGNRTINISGCVTAFTGRACENLSSKGVPAVTAHSLLYKPVLDEAGNLLYFKKKNRSEVLSAVGEFAIVEEASMMDMSFIDLLVESGVAIIYVGDDAQLPPISGPSIFDKIEKSVMEGSDGPFSQTPVLMLDEIKRTAEGSSINLFADVVRRTGKLSRKDAGEDVEFVSKNELDLRWFKDNADKIDVIICGTNNLRKKYNRLVRAARRFQGDLPEVGERVICLKNSVVGGFRINNGELFEVVARFVAGEKISTFHLKKVSADGDAFRSFVISVNVDNNMWDEECRLDENKGRQDLHDFTFGYAMTVHRMQGSSGRTVLFVDEDVSFFLDRQKFRYTAVTRASEKLIIAV